VARYGDGHRSGGLPSLAAMAEDIIRAAMGQEKVGDAPWCGTKSHSMRILRLTIQGTQDEMVMPVEVSTKVREVKYVLCQKLAIEADQMKFLVRQSSSIRQLRDSDEMSSSVIVKGIRGWEREKARWPHPICVIGAGHSGLRQSLSFLKEGVRDFTVYDKHDAVGGTAWVTNANPTSKLQTELGVYHLQYDKDYPIPRATMRTWPTRDELLRHFREVSEEYGILAHVQLGTEVTEIQVVIHNKDLAFHDPKKQEYGVVTRRSDNASGEEAEVTFSAVADYPGTLVSPLRLDYKGEDVFEGHIGYGMFNEFDYSQVRGGVPAIMGFGAFAVENIRTCLEKGAVKVWLVCRRKNIAMPRVMSWFMNQSLYPPPGAMVMDAMQLMYDLLPDDPWTYYGIMANKDRTTCTIRQKSRFGIGDVYFLAVHYQKAEVVVDGIKRLKPRQILLESGGKLDADHLIKVLGFKGDFSVDKVMGVREMVGYFVNGDFRRWICAEFPGIDAGKFGGTSFSPGGIQNAEFYTWFLNYPKDLAPVFDNNVLPRKKPDKEKVVPTYVWDPRQGSSIMMMLSGGIIPALGELAVAYGPLNRAKQLEAHPLEQFVDECADEWYGYCRMFKDAGDDRPFPPYPYTHSYVRELCRRNDEEGEADALRQAQRG